MLYKSARILTFEIYTSFSILYKIKKSHIEKLFKYASTCRMKKCRFQEIVVSEKKNVNFATGNYKNIICCFPYKTISFFSL